MKAPKALKITWMGQPLRNVYPHARWYQVAWYRFWMWVRWFTIRLSIGLGIALLVVGAYQYGEFEDKRTLAYIAPTATSSMQIATHGKTITQLQDEALTMLSYGCEVKGVPAAQQEGKITFDSNAKPSIGLFQYQQGTVVDYVKRRDKKDITFAEANIIASTKEQAWELSRWIAFTSGIGTVPDWYNCSNKEFTVNGETVQLRDYIAFINSMSN